MTGYLIVDASFTFRLVLSSPSQTDLLDQVERQRQEGYILCAPTLWLYEMISSLSKALRFGELAYDEVRKALTFIRELEVQLISPDEEQIEKALAWTIHLNRAAAYDSFYLALAETLNCELWTADQRLKNAADLPWVRLIPEKP